MILQVFLQTKIEQILEYNYDNKRLVGRCINMKKTDNQIIIEKLVDFEKRCDEFLETIQCMEILNLNFDTPKDAIIDVNSPAWKMFHNDLLAMIKKYKGELGWDFERFILMFHKTTQYPDYQNISDLKVSLYSLKNYIEDELSDVTENNIWAFMHPQILKVSKSRFEDGYYADAVESAFKEINSRVKRLYQFITGEEKDGADLMRKAFSPSKPILIFESLDSQSGRSVQQGYMDVFAGAMTGIRNPKAHENMTITELQAIQRLMFASLLMSKIDEAVAYTAISE